MRLNGESLVFSKEYGEFLLSGAFGYTAVKYHEGQDRRFDNEDFGCGSYTRIYLTACQATSHESYPGGNRVASMGIYKRHPLGLVFFNHFGDRYEIVSVNFKTVDDCRKRFDGSLLLRIFLELETVMQQNNRSGCDVRKNPVDDRGG